MERTMARAIPTPSSERRDHQRLQHNEAAAALSVLGYEHNLEEPAIRL
jgi:hypothetical protein